jgi:hypothetical protein
VIVSVVVLLKLVFFLFIQILGDCVPFSIPHSACSACLRRGRRGQDSWGGARAAYALVSSVYTARPLFLFRHAGFCAEKKAKNWE